MVLLKKKKTNVVEAGRCPTNLQNVESSSLLFNDIIRIKLFLDDFVFTLRGLFIPSSLFPPPYSSRICIELFIPQKEMAGGSLGCGEDLGAP